MISLRDLAIRHQHTAALVARQLPVPDPAAISSGLDGGCSAENCATASPMAEHLGQKESVAVKPALVLPLRPSRHLPLPPLVADQEAFRKGFAWLHPRNQTLIEGGWTRPELYRRNRARRGIAWLALWANEEVTSELLPDGGIRFSFRRPGRHVVQIARPRNRCPGVSVTR